MDTLPLKDVMIGTNEERFACGVWCLRFGHPDQGAQLLAPSKSNCCGLGENRVGHASMAGITAGKIYFDLLSTIPTFWRRKVINMLSDPRRIKAQKIKEPFSRIFSNIKILGDCC